jgi:transcription elongation factor Elf1
MGYTNFFPHGNKSVIVRFTCDKCGNDVESEEIEIPTPNSAAEKESDSYSENEGGAVCKNCGKDFNVNVYAGYADGYVRIDDVDDAFISVKEKS